MSTSSNNPVLALYDFRSKQEYIYRTNKIREISGASRLLEGIYNQMINCLNASFKGQSVSGKPLFYGDDNLISYDDFLKNKECLGQVLYQGGGSLMMLYRDESTYKNANRIISRMVIERSHTLQLIAACVEIDNPSKFNELREMVYANLAKTKRSLMSFSPCSITPFTQIDISSHQAIAEKVRISGEGERELTNEAFLKLKAYYNLLESKDKKTKTLDDAVTEKGEESLLAVIYIDGNNIGSKLMEALSECDGSFDKGVAGLRSFSADIHHRYVTTPFIQFDDWIGKNEVYLADKLKSKWYYRRVIGGGDEITIICNARLALKFVQLYFDALGEDNEYSACAGVSIFHSHAPFATAYEIAEECCENAKELAKTSEVNMNCFDFFFCRSGITNNMENLRNKEDGRVTGLPYNVGEFIDAVSTKIVPLFSSIGRSNVKALNTAILKGDDYYLFEVDRINAYCGEVKISHEDALNLKNIIFDTSGVYDIWFDDDMDYSKKGADVNEA